MNVSDALAVRHAVRAFRPDPVDGPLLRDLLRKASRAPSNGNLQPWHVVALGGATLAGLKARVAERQARGESDPLDYAVYPERLWDPLRGRRKEAGRQRYEALGFDEKDPRGLAELTARNQRFFDAPAALFFFLDRRVGPPQWADLGMYMQSVMLLAVEAGLATCPQAYWSNWPKTVSELLGIDPGLMLVAGMALGYADETNVLAALRTERAPLADFAMFKDI